MARTKKEENTTNLPATWDEELAKYAEAAAETESGTSVGQFISIKGGQMSYNGNPIPGNALVAVVVDYVLENVFYEGSYDPDTPQTPACFAFGRVEKDMTAHEKVEEPQCESCEKCEQNVFGSAMIGKGKACRNTRRLALVAAGMVNSNGKIDLVDDAEELEAHQIAYMKLPVTSVKGFSSVVKQLAAIEHLPPFGVYMKISTVPDPKTQFKVVFEPIAKVPQSLLGVVMKRHQEAAQLIDFPYVQAVESEEPPAKKKLAAAKQKAKRKF